LFLSQQTVDFLRQFNELLRVPLSFSQLTKFSPAILIFLHGIGSEDALFLAQLFSTECSISDSPEAGSLKYKTTYPRKILSDRCKIERSL